MEQTRDANGIPRVKVNALKLKTMLFQQTRMKVKSRNIAMDLFVTSPRETFAGIAERHGVTRQNVNRIHKRILLELEIAEKINHNKAQRLSNG
jgi:hypothetical protein